MAKIAFITGIAGQDGAYLAQFLLGHGYKVHGLLRWDSYVDPMDGLKRLEALGLVSDEITLHVGDVTDTANIFSLIKSIQPDEIYNLAALSHVKVSFETPGSTLDINAKGTLNILEAVRILGTRARIYQASSSEMFGSSPAPQNEDTPFHPCSPYGVAKLSAYWMARTYRESYGIHVSNGILFNHESILRGQDFVTAKIARGVADMEAGSREPLVLGNLDSKRDWGHARDYVVGMWAMVKQDVPGDYVLATGEAHSVREFFVRAFAQIGVTVEWRGNGVDEIGIDAASGRVVVKIDADLFRPNEVHYLLGDAKKAREVLGWVPKISFDELVAEMVNAARQSQWKEPQWKMVS